MYVFILKNKQEPWSFRQPFKTYVAVITLKKINVIKKKIKKNLKFEFFLKIIPHGPYKVQKNRIRAL